PSAERRLPMKPAGCAVGWWIEPAIPCTSSPLGRWSGFPVDPSSKQGEQISGPPKARVPSPEAASAGGEENGAVAKGSFAGIPTYFVVHPSSPLVAIYGSTPRLVGLPVPGMPPLWTP